MKLTSYGMTDIGLKRRINQDAFLKDDSLGLYVVADGMGGHRGGEVASQMAVEGLQRFCKANPELEPQELLDKGINLCCEEIFKEAAQNSELAGMGTTVIALLLRDNRAYIGQVGDSRAYLLQNENIWQVTEDHSLLNEEIRAGRIAADEAANYQFRNVITRSVGYEKQVLVDIYRREILVGDIFLACTDGLSGLVEINEMKESIVKQGIETGLISLVALANSRGGDDNITAMAVQVA